MDIAFVNLRCAVAIATALLSPLSFAATAPAPGRSADAAYQADRAACRAGATPQDRATCLREAAAARAEARRGRLGSASAQTLRDNALRRCQVHPAGPDRTACERMVGGEGTVAGSVESGGRLRQLTTVTEGAADPAALPPSAPAR